MKSTHDKILDWLDGNMPPDERAAFESEMSQNQELAEEVRLVRDALAAIHEPSVINFRRQLDGIMEEELSDHPTLPNGPTVRKGLIIRYGLVVAGLVIMAALIFWFKNAGLLSPSTATSDTPIAVLDYYQRPQTLPATSNHSKRNDQEELSFEVAIRPLFNQLESEFNNGDFQAALSTLDKIAKLDTAQIFLSNTTFFTSKGILLLQLDRPAEALAQFEASELQRATEICLWYKSEALLRLEKKEEARQILRILAGQSGNPFQQLAVKVIEGLE